MMFSVCTPVVYTRDDPDNLRQPRYEMFLRCAASVFSQTFEDFEWVVVDDMCQPPVEECPALDPYNMGRPGFVKVVRLPEKLGRIAARNIAMKEASGDWITWLDADDEYASIYLQAFADAIRLYPEYKAFSSNHLVFNYDYTTHVRKFVDFETLGGKPFGSGTIGAGSFIFKRELLDKMGYLPEVGLWDLAEAARKEFPEIAPFFWNETNQDYNSLGNPWGEDYYWFYKLYKQTPVKYLDTALYFVHSHYGHRFKTDPDYTMGDDKKPHWNPNVI